MTSEDRQGVRPPPAEDFVTEWARAYMLDPARLAVYLPHLIGKTRAEIEAEAAEMEPDPEALAEMDQIDRELDGASWEAFQAAEAAANAAAAQERPA